MGDHHCVDCGDIAQRSRHKRRKHFRVAQDVLVQGDRVVGVAQLGLAVGENAPDANSAGTGGLPVSAQGGFILLVEDGVHFKRDWGIFYSQFRIIPV